MGLARNNRAIRARTKMLRYTAQPIADIGIATIAAFCGKTDPSSLPKKDLAKTAKFLEQEYFSGKLTFYLTCVVLCEEERRNLSA